MMKIKHIYFKVCLNNRQKPGNNIVKKLMLDNKYNLHIITNQFLQIAEQHHCFFK